MKYSSTSRTSCFQDIRFSLLSHASLPSGQQLTCRQGAAAAASLLANPRHHAQPGTSDLCADTHIMILAQYLFLSQLFISYYSTIFFQQIFRDLTAMLLLTASTCDLTRVLSKTLC